MPSLRYDTKQNIIPATTLLFAKQSFGGITTLQILKKSALSGASCTR